MFLEVVILWPAIYGTLIGVIVLGLIFGFVLIFLKSNKKKKALHMAKEKNYIGAIQLLNELITSRSPLPQIEISEIYLSIACIYLIISDEDKFLEAINKVTYKKLFTLKSFWKSLYYLEKNDLEHYLKSKEDITKNFNLNDKLKIEDKAVLDKYLYILKSLEEKDNPERKDILNKIIQQQNEKRVSLLKEYLSKFI